MKRLSEDWLAFVIGFAFIALVYLGAFGRTVG